ncbi:MAG: hypothetical protein DRN08_06975 [Thermoplasmata archaeon]|nr:MAG: hypothetical protein DRN08_06975 [Thermoplasmata archaeon]
MIGKGDPVFAAVVSFPYPALGTPDVNYAGVVRIHSDRSDPARGRGISRPGLIDDGHWADELPASLDPRLFKGSALKRTVRNTRRQFRELFWLHLLNKGPGGQGSPWRNDK